MFLSSATRLHTCVSGISWYVRWIDQLQVGDSCSVCRLPGVKRHKTGSTKYEHAETFSEVLDFILILIPFNQDIYVETVKSTLWLWIDTFFEKQDNSFEEVSRKHPWHQFWNICGEWWTSTSSAYWRSTTSKKSRSKFDEILRVVLQSPMPGARHRIIQLCYYYIEIYYRSTTHPPHRVTPPV